MPESAVLECRGLVQRFGRRTVLRVDAFTLERGARLALVGPNGAGKSSLLRLLAFVDTPSEGTIALDGQVVARRAARRAARRRVTLVEQRPLLFRGTVTDNVTWGLRARGADARTATRAAGEALERLDAGALAGRDARALSDGEVQRVAVARALALAPDVLLLDEPVSGADRAAEHALYAALAAPGRAPVAVCIASHQLEAAYRWADRIVALHEGVQVPVTPENLFRVTLPGGAPMQRVTIDGVALDVVSDRSGPATLAIPPDEILLSTEPLRSSARNVIAGRIVRVAEQGAAMRVTVDGGIEIVALVTRRSYEDLGLAVGGTVFASFKSVAVRVY